MTKRKIEYGVIPPEQDAECVAWMEEGLETSAQAYDPKYPVLCMDEQPVQLLKETRVPVAATTKHGRRVDCEYERNGTASIFMFAEPLSGFRQATARSGRTKADWASEVAHVLDTRYAACEDVTLVCDNLNTHTKGAFYEAFEPAVPTAPAWLQRAGLGADVIGTGATQRGSEGGGCLMLTTLRGVRPAIGPISPMTTQDGRSGN